MIEVRSLTRRFGRVCAVDDVSFTVGDNQVVGLLGHNGAGKTTMLRMLSGYLEPSAGQIVIGGTDLSQKPHSIQANLGYLPEHLPVYPDMIVADYMDYAATLKGIPARARLAAVREALIATDLLGKALEPVGVLSRGYKQRVGVAQALLGKPGLLILDEPTNGLDPSQTVHMRELIKQLATYTTVILSTHILQEVSAVCDRVLMMRNGQLVIDRSLAELQDSKTLVLRASDCPDTLLQEIRQIPAVETVEARPASANELHLAVQLAPGAQVDSLANDLATRVIQAGGKLHQVEVPSRDLDSIFSEVYRHDD